MVNAALYQVAGNLKKFVAPDSTEESDLRKLFDKLSAGQVKRLGWTPKYNESIDDQLTRPYVLNAALYAKNKDSITEAHSLFESNKENLVALPADIRVYVLANEVQNYSSLELLKKLFNDYTQTSDGSYKADISVALPMTPDKDLLAKIVDQYENSEVIKPQDLRAWYRGVLANDNGQQLAWDWIRNDWQWLEDTVGGDMEFSTFITVTSGIFKTPQRLDEFKKFFEPKINTPGLTREIQMDTKVIESRVSLIEDEKEAVNKAVSLFVFNN